MQNDKVAKDHNDVKKNSFTLHKKTLCCITVLKIQGRILQLVLQGRGIKAAFCSISHNGTFSQNYGIYVCFFYLLSNNKYTLSPLKKKINVTM